ncbi:MalY/PatB family protein [Planomonospora parontospora]|uniref:MalY/PatB family protein n=1 Tax=Planomonospora parontospora TaxID=58119 RepID=UPI00198B5686|nr:aminotransferase class I/II-fold pyridoxal phosphate-dependent enzyme [Planomonospora parontospora]GGL18512.1 aminotransferase [Planomonospora parontospora subsp. antibiotica]GII15548.1 aminotransferase [Planomonospora parontospora subsp. antibiotica]
MSDISDLNDLTLESLTTRDGAKWSLAEPGVIPAWVADMDFPVAPAVREALARRIHGDLGYPAWLDQLGDGPLAEVFAARMEQRHGWRADPAHVRSFTDINQALQVVLHVATRPGDAVALHVPTYPPFLETLAEMGRPPLPIPMEPVGDSWGFDADALAARLAEGRCRVLLLVNPQNPTGRSFTREELTVLAELAERHDLLVVSDEIHADLTHAPSAHVPFATLLPERTVTLTSATKAFNLGGIRCSVAHFGPPALRAAMAAQPRHMYGAAHVFGVDATVAAWTRGDGWLEEVRAVLARNRSLVAGGLPEGVRYRIPDATYLAWLDFTDLALGEDPAEFLKREARVMLSQGPPFGPGGEGFARLNFATSGPVLSEILDRITRAVKSRS